MTRLWPMLGRLSLGSCILTAVSCSTVVKDIEFCGDLGADGASCFHTLKKDSRNLTKAQWDQDRMGAVCTSGQGIAEVKREIEQLCHVANCDYDTQASISAFFEKAQAVQAKVKGSK